MANHNCVSKQIDTLVLFTILDNKDYQSEGITTTNLCARLSDNRLLWFEVGHVKDKKDFVARIRGSLSRLYLKGYLYRPEKGLYFMSKDFMEGLKKSVIQLWECLEIETEVDEFNPKKLKQILLKTGVIPSEILKSIQNKKLHLLTVDNIIRFTKFYVQSV